MMQGSKIAIARLWNTLGPTSQRDVRWDFAIGIGFFTA